MKINDRIAIISACLLWIPTSGLAAEPSLQGAAASAGLAVQPMGAENLASSPAAIAQMGDACQLDDTFWLKPRSGAAIMSNADIAPCVQHLLNDPTASLRISYPDNDELAVEADELRQWLLALALPAARISLKKQSGLTAIELDIKHNTPKND